MTGGQDLGNLTYRLLRELASASELPASDLDSIAVLIQAGEELGVPAAHLLGDPWAPAPDPSGGC